jgi:hypothetical protein
MQSLEKKLTEASSFLNGLRGTKPTAENALSWALDEKVGNHR